MRLTKRQLLYFKSNQAGFTIIESLMAIIVVAILMVGLAPVIAVSTATRVQARRVEWATSAAKTYIDGVRSGAIAAPTNTVSLTPSQYASDRSSFKNTGNVPSSTLSASCMANSPCTAGAQQVFCIDGDGDGFCKNDSLKDMIVHPFRSAIAGAAIDDTDKGYLLGVRVYRADAFTSGRTLTGGTGNKASTFTGSTGLGSIQAPMVEMTTEIVTSKTKYSDLCQRLGGCS